MRAAVAVIVLSGALAATGCGGNGGGTAANGCESVDKPAPRQPSHLKPPPMQLNPSKTYALSFRTSCGTFVVRLDTRLAPNTTASLVALVRSGYFDDTIFHRIVPGFVIQGGDPTQSGAGGPGYATLDAPPPTARYTKGVVAMAKAPTEAPGTSGSQFFVVTAGDAGLTPDYAIVGRVTQGMDVVERIGALGGPDEKPTRTVLISKVLVAEHS